MTNTSNDLSQKLFLCDPRKRYVYHESALDVYPLIWSPHDV